MAAAQLSLHLLNAACLEYQTQGKDRKRRRAAGEDEIRDEEVRLYLHLEGGRGEEDGAY